MKLVIIITHKENSKRLEEKLVKKNFQFTKLETIGGFLGKRNITYLLGIEDQKVDFILEIIKKTCKTHEEVVGSPWFTTGQPGEVLIPNGRTKITVGGATVFVVKADKFAKV